MLIVITCVPTVIFLYFLLYCCLYISTLYIPILNCGLIRRKYILQGLCLGQETNEFMPRVCKTSRCFSLKDNLQHPLVRERLLGVVASGPLHCANHLIFLLFRTKYCTLEIVSNFLLTVIM